MMGVSQEKMEWSREFSKRKGHGSADRKRERGKIGGWRLAGHGQELGLNLQSHWEPQKTGKLSRPA